MMTENFLDDESRDALLGADGQAPHQAMSGEEAFTRAEPAGEPLDPERDPSEVLKISLNNYEGPLELLLDLARQQKVDLKEISLSLLVDQYILFIERVKKDHIDIAAEYLVMAAWLAFLKSKLLLPQAADAVDEPPEAMIARRALQMLDAMRQKSVELFARHRCGVDFFLKGMVEELPEEVETRWETDVNKLISAYAEAQNAKPVKQLDILPTKLTSPEMAIEKLRRALPFLTDWTVLENFLGKLFNEGFDNDLQWRAAYASSFFASLELARQGLIEIRQNGIFKDLEIRQKTSPQETNQQ
ncbi:MAG: ScpA family protein [Hydrotalea sp.]|nr:ScpA family protein [Hydrotalea sp.]